jgi:hypothetical protein
VMSVQIAIVSNVAPCSPEEIDSLLAVRITLILEAGNFSETSVSI